MSNKLREYISCSGDEGENMHITAFVGGVKNKASIQFTIGMKYCCLNQRQLKDLMKVIKDRLSCVKGYSATDTFTGKILRR